MGIFAHGLWSAAAAKAGPKLEDRQLRPSLAALWGVFPDLFAFVPPWIWIFTVSGFSGTYVLGNGEALPEKLAPALRMAAGLYNLSHSAVVFALCFCIAWLAFRRPVYEMYAWFLHILIDLPTHTAGFFPTPVLWPVSSWTFTHGISWGTWSFQLINYSLLALAFGALVMRRQKNRG
jgi:hypothetical protein